MKTVGVKVTERLNEILANGTKDMRALAICNKAFKCDTAYLDGETLKAVIEAGCNPVVIDVVL